MAAQLDLTAHLGLDHPHGVKLPSRRQSSELHRALGPTLDRARMAWKLGLTLAISAGALLAMWLAGSQKRSG